MPDMPRGRPRKRSGGGDTELESSVYRPSSTHILARPEKNAPPERHGRRGRMVSAEINVSKIQLCLGSSFRPRPSSLPTISRTALYLAMTSLSVLDLSPIIQGGDAAQSLRNTLDLARHAERWGYCRYWLAE